MDRASSHASLALLLRYEHPDRARDERKTRSVCGIRQALSHDRSALHAVGLGLEKLCECPAKHRDGSDLGTVCPCFSAADLSATALYLSKNDLTVGSVEVLSAFHALETLSLADNVIERVPEALRGMHKLKRLSLAGNPVMTRPHATEQILAFRPSLTELNGRRVDEREKQMARDVYKEECVLANICHLLGLLRTEEPGEGWVRALDRVERVLVGGVSSLEQLSDELFLFDETASFRWGDEATCGVSRNHELTVVANTAWVGGLAFFMSDNPEETCVEKMLLEVTSSLVSLESLCREKEEGRQLADVQALALSVWHAVFEYRDAILRIQQELSFSEAANAMARDALAKKRDALAEEVCVHRDQIRQLRAQRDDAIKQNVHVTQQLQVLKQRVEASAVECDGLRTQLEDAVQEHVRLGTQLEDAVQEHVRSKHVMHMVSGQLEACKRSEDLLTVRNQALVDELDAANRTRAAAGAALAEAQADLAAQKSSFEGVIRDLRSELDALRREPRIPLQIKIVDIGIDADLTRELSERDLLNSRLRAELEAIASELALYQRQEWFDASAQSYRREKARERVALASSYCFRSWVGHVRRRRAVNRLQAVLVGIIVTGTREAAKRAMAAWRRQAGRSRVATALGEVRRATASTGTTRLVLRGWHNHAGRQARVAAFVTQRSSNVARRALSAFGQHVIHQRERLALSGRELADLTLARAKSIVFDAWRRATSLRVAELEVVTSSFLQSCTVRAAHFAFQAWITAARDAREDRRHDLAARRLHETTIKSSAFRVLTSYTREAQSRRKCAERMWAERSRTTLIESFRSWRAWQLRKRALLASTFLAWRSHTRVQRKRLQSALFLAAAVASTRCSTLEGLLHATTERAERDAAQALKMAAACDSLHGRLSESRESHGKAISKMAQMQSRLANEKRSLGKQLNAELRDNRRLLASVNLLQATNRRLELSLEAMEDRERQVETVNKHLALRLRASDAVKSSAQIRAEKNVRRTDDAEWAIGAYE